VCPSDRRPGGAPGRRCAWLVGGGADVSMLPLVCLRVDLLRMRPRPVAAALTPGLGVLFTLAVATRPG